MFKQFFLKNLLLITTVSLAACSSVKEYNLAITEKKHSVQTLKQDIDLTHQILKDGHPGLYWYISKKQLDFKFDSLKNAINEPLTTRQFYQKLSPVVAAIRCGHTALRFPSVIQKDKKEREATKNKIYPLHQFTYAVSEDKLIVINNKSKNKNIKTGTEILEIDGLAPKEIFNIVSTGFSYDGYNSLSRNKRIERNFAQLYKIYFSEQDSVAIKFKTDSAVINTFVSFYDKKKDAEAKKKLDTAKTVAKVPDKKIKKTLKYRGNKVNNEYQLDFKFLDQEKDIAYLKIKSFSVPTANFKQFYKQAFDSISLSKSKNLVIDIRNNPGGTLSASLALFSYLTDKDFVYLAKPINNGGFSADKYQTGLKKLRYYLTAFNDNGNIYEDDEGNFFSFMKGYKPQKPHKNNYKGKVYVLINEFSFSASSLISANLKGINRATFVGTETGGGANQCTAGRMPVVTLKNSKLDLRFGLNRMAPIYQQDLYGRGVFPDVEVQSTLKDRISNYERELQWILTDIKGKG
ncbi:S41 family peptidase [Pedobacter xixiisoli]|uniref:Peptidase family S41 n=1 Tax=Pedobacter xixiisoli TaxID=1476464 RepID=A0A286ADK5_9SPHI|nr:S41 family peptidase [Pedobacter xixiisoli]SOD19955.1 Peptidase family S41 [Pedobacter xixiisoli]